MFSSILLLLPVLSLVSRASASAISPFGGVHQLLSRQTAPLDPDTFPSECRTACATVVSTSTNCQPPAALSCGCSAAEERGFVSCANCLLGVAGTPSSSFTKEIQSIIDDYVVGCARAGVILPTTTVSGGVSEATLPPAVSGTARPTSASVTAPPPTRTPSFPTTVNQITVTAPNPSPSSTSGADPNNPLGIGNSASRETIGRVAVVLAAVAVAVLV